MNENECSFDIFSAPMRILSRSGLRDKRPLNAAALQVNNSHLPKTRPRPARCFPAAVLHMKHVFRTHSRVLRGFEWELSEQVFSLLHDGLQSVDGLGGYWGGVKTADS